MFIEPYWKTDAKAAPVGSSISSSWLQIRVILAPSFGQMLDAFYKHGSVESTGGATKWRVKAGDGSFLSCVPSKGVE